MHIRRPSVRYASQTVGLAACACCLATTLLAGADDPASFCDPGLRGSKADPFAYEVRGDRCEGRYAQEVAGGLLRIASFTASRERFDPANSGELRLEWQARAGAPIRLRAQSLRPRVYYRMDTERPATPASYSWSTAVVAALQISSNDLGVLAWRRESVGDRDRDVYLPLHLGQREGASSTGSDYLLIAVPGRELEELYLSVSAVDANGAREETVTGGRALGYGYYPAGEAVAVDIPRPGRPGLYRVDLGAKLRGGGATSEEFWFRYLLPGA